MKNVPCKTILAASLLLVFNLFILPSPNLLAATCPIGATNSIRVAPGGILTVSNTASQENFSTTGDKCIIDPKAVIPDFQLPTSFNQMKVTYYDQSTATKPTPPPPTSANLTVFDSNIPQIPAPAGGDNSQHSYLYNIETNLEVAGNLGQVPPNTTVIIFVQQNLYIKSDIDLKGSGNSASVSRKGVVFIVNGGIFVDKNVKNIDAFMVTFGTNVLNANPIPPPFCSAADLSIADILLATCPSPYIQTSKLTINGSLVSLNVSLGPQFIRSNLVNPDDPAEVIEYQPKYLSILNNTFSKDLNLWSEIK